MTRVNKGVALLLITMLAVSSLILVESTSAQSIPKPSVPEFSLKVVSYPYDVAPTTTTDPYTGKNITTSNGYHVENKSIEVTIKNQPFTSTLDESGNYANLYYNVRFKGHYEDKWKYYPVDESNSNYSTSAVPHNASQSDYTTINLGLATYQLNNVLAGGQIDVQVQAFIGFENRVDFFFLGGESNYYTFSAFERSDWSSTQTIAIGQSDSTATPNAPLSQNSTTSTPSELGPGNADMFGLSWGEIVIIVLLSCIAVLLFVGVVFLHKRSKRQTS